jgi:hypothetical protein
LLHGDHGQCEGREDEDREGTCGQPAKARAAALGTGAGGEELMCQRREVVAPFRWNAQRGGGELLAAEEAGGGAPGFVPGGGVAGDPLGDADQVTIFVDPLA